MWTSPKQKDNNTHTHQPPPFVSDSFVCTAQHLTWVKRLFCPTSPRRIFGVHYCPVKRQILRREYSTCLSQTRETSSYEVCN